MISDGSLTILIIHFGGTDVYLSHAPSSDLNPPFAMVAQMNMMYAMQGYAPMGMPYAGGMPGTMYNAAASAYPAQPTGGMGSKPQYNQQNQSKASSRVSVLPGNVSVFRIQFSRLECSFRMLPGLY